VVDNLLDNARKYSAPGRPIVVATREDGGSALIVAEDSGCGIAREDLRRIFEPFFRSSSTAHQGVAGSGLGLSVVARIVTAFGGAVEAESQVGRGGRFVARLLMTKRPDDRPHESPCPHPTLSDAGSVP
jgi:signal transduction histidine kinase